MARFRKARRSHRVGKKSHHRKSSGSKSSIKSIGMSAAGAGIYGYARQKLSNVVTPFVANYLPASFAPYADEIALGGSAIIARLASRNSTVHKIADVVITVEAFRAGSLLAGSMTKTGVTGASSDLFSGNPY